MFLRRFIRHVFLAASLLLGSLAIGVMGYHGFEQISWIDSLLNASMILGGMGPVAELHNPGAKLFAGFYALFSGLAFVGVAGIIILQIEHRLLHLLHLESK